MAVKPHRLTLWKRNGTYYVGYREGGRRRRKSTRATTKHEALRALADLDEVLIERAVGMSLERFVEEFLAYSESNHRPGTVRLFRGVLSRFSSFAGVISIREVTPAMVDLFKTWRLRSVKPVSFKSEFRMLRAALSVAER